MRPKKTAIWTKAIGGGGHLCTLDTYLVFLVFIFFIRYSIHDGLRWLKVSRTF